MRLLELDGWTFKRRATHGLLFSKQFAGEPYPRTTTVMDKGSQVIPSGTLGATLGVKQTGLGQNGLEALIEQYGLNA
jgi:hypothetical protein